MGKKLTYEHVKEYIENVEGYKLLSKSYINNNSKLLISHLDHDFEMTFRAFDSGQRCSACYGTPKHTYSYISKYIESFGYSLLSKNYFNNSTKLTIKCPKNHILEMEFKAFWDGNRCAECFGNKKHTLDEIKDYIKLKDYELLSDNYKNAFDKLLVKCPKNHVYEVTWSNFKKGRKCPICRYQSLISKEEKEITNYVKSIYAGYIVENDRTQIINPKTGYFLELDVWMPEIKKAIEYNGEYWHNKKSAKYKDTQKLIQCKQKGISLLVIDGSLWQKNKNFTMINNFIGL